MSGTQHCKVCKESWKIPKEAGKAYDSIKTCPVVNCPFDGKNVEWMANLAEAEGYATLAEAVARPDEGLQPIFGELNARRM